MHIYLYLTSSRTLANIDSSTALVVSSALIYRYICIYIYIIYTYRSIYVYIDRCTYIYVLPPRVL